MGPAEKKVVAALSVVLIALVAVLVLWKPATKVASPLGAGTMSSGPAGAQSSSGACATTPGAGAEGVPTQEFGKKGAKMEILALLPITHGCHVNTEAELKKAYQAHPNDIHLKIVDLFGAEGQKLAQENGGTRALVLINGKSSFTVGNREVVLERTEGPTYVPTDISAIVDQELKAKS
jgi:hypothetical protein